MMDRKGTSKASARTGIAVLVALVASSMPAAQAADAPVVFCMRTYGHELPGKCDPNPNQLESIDDQGKVYPDSALYTTSLGSNGVPNRNTGNIFVEGNATPGSTVVLTVTDGVRTLGPFQASASLGNDGGARPGDFLAEIAVAELGAHAATPNADADTVGDDELGPATLTVRAYAVDGNGVGPSVTDTIVKHAATHDDRKAPRFSSQKWPPRDIDRGCSGRTTGPILDPNIQAAWSFFFTGRSPILFTSTCPWFTISGAINDFDVPSNTVSEIRDVRIVIEKQSYGQTFLDVRHSIDTPLLPPGHPAILTRAASNVSTYAYIINSNDLPTNAGAWIGADDSYTITVIACDAWGDVSAPATTNCATSSYGDIIVYPF